MVFGVKCIFDVGGLGFVDSVDRYFVYGAIMCRQVEVVVLQYFNLAQHLSGSHLLFIFIFLIRVSAGPGKVLEYSM